MAACAEAYMSAASRTILRAAATRVTMSVDVLLQTAWRRASSAVSALKCAAHAGSIVARCRSRVHARVCAVA